jgi:WD40 repeat protein
MRRFAVLLVLIFVFRSAYPCFGGEPKERIVLPHSGSVISTVFTPDGKTLISSGNESITLWDVLSGKEKGRLTKDDSGPKLVAVSLNGKLLASGNWDTTVRLWDIGSRAEIATLRGHTGPVLGVAFSPDGSLLASGARDRKWEKAEVKLWDLRTRTELASLPGVADPVGRLAFSPDGKTVAVGDLSGKVFLWDVASKKVRLCIEAPNYVSKVIWSHDGNAHIGRQRYSNLGSCHRHTNRDSPGRGRHGHRLRSRDHERRQTACFRQPPRHHQGLGSCHRRNQTHAKTGVEGIRRRRLLRHPFARRHAARCRYRPNGENLGHQGAFVRGRRRGRVQVAGADFRK